jgi:hypothetical protein
VDISLFLLAELLSTSQRINQNSYDPSYQDISKFFPLTAIAKWLFLAY